MILNNRTKLKMNLQFFAENESGQEKTEEPTARRRRKAKEDGKIPQSQEVGTAFVFIFVFLILKFFGRYFYQNLLSIYRGSFYMISDIDNIYNDIYIAEGFSFVFSRVLLVIAPILLTALVVGVFASVIQVGWNPTLKPLKPDFGKINPIKGFKNIFISKKALIEFAKMVLKISIIVTIVYLEIRGSINKVYSFLEMELLGIISVVMGLIINIGIKVGIFFIFVAIIDYYVEWKKNEENLKMTKKEVKDEHKETDGNPEIKRKIRQRMQEVSMRRMMSDVAEADVIITNPTHFAVAIKYDKELSNTPKVTAKGADFLAQRIKEKAREENVEIVENKPLARTLYAACEIGDEIPEEMFQAVAEVLAFVYKLEK